MNDCSFIRTYLLFTILDRTGTHSSEWCKPFFSFQELQQSASTLKLGGAERDRTADPLLAKQVLSQLSYSPSQKVKQQSCKPLPGPAIGGPGQTRTADLTLIRRAL